MHPFLCKDLRQDLNSVEEMLGRQKQNGMLGCYQQSGNTLMLELCVEVSSSATESPLTKQRQVFCHSTETYPDLDTKLVLCCVGDLTEGLCHLSHGK